LRSSSSSGAGAHGSAAAVGVGLGTARMRGPGGGGGGGGGDGGLGGGLLHRPMESSWNRDGSAGLSGGGLSGALGAKQAFEQSRVADTLKLEAQGDALLRALGAASKVSGQAGGGRRK
jgi:hypothetical protein